ncbi:hypothetical protein K1719_038220 [Acacia pycnantha]|nr:hypothetical protein K1719_038220 [Acacia pycnantha]
MESRFSCLGRMGYDSVRVIPSSGQSGRLAVGWMSSRINVSVLEEYRQFFHLYCQIPQLEPFYITAVYSIPYPCFKASLWESLLRLSQMIGCPWSVIGDFNEILANSERIGGGGGSYCRMRLFQERINDCCLTDIGAVGPKMTWKGPRLLVSPSRLLPAAIPVVVTQRHRTPFPLRTVVKMSSTDVTSSTTSSKSFAIKPPVHPTYDLKNIIKLALAEDAGDKGDISCLATIPYNMGVDAYFLAKEDGIIAGIALAEMIFHEVDPSLRVEWSQNDGDYIHKGLQFGKVHGRAHNIVVAERVVLNFMQRMSGIATLTKQMADAAYPAYILETRKLLQVYDYWISGRY